jgi:hypothetical protein
MAMLEYMDEWIPGSHLNVRPGMTADVKWPDDNDGLCRAKTKRIDLPLRDRLQTLEGQAFRILDARKIEPANEGGDHFAVTIGQRNDGINGNSLGVHGIPHAALRATA